MVQKIHKGCLGYRAFCSMLGVLILTQPRWGYSQQYSSEERSSAAIGHYARARAMLVEALAEFEQARKLARPDLLLDPEQWRSSVVSRAEDLNRVLDPQPRVTRSGVHFKANRLLLRKPGEQLPSSAAQVKDTTYEEERSHERTIIRIPRSAKKGLKKETKTRESSKVRSSVDSALVEQKEKELEKLIQESDKLSSSATTSAEKEATSTQEKTRGKGEDREVRELDSPKEAGVSIPSEASTESKTVESAETSPQQALDNELEEELTLPKDKTASPAKQTSEDKEKTGMTKGFEGSSDDLLNGEEPEMNSVIQQTIQKRLKRVESEGK